MAQERVPEFRCKEACGECCRWVYVVPDRMIHDRKGTKEWGLARGIWKLGGLLIPHVCPQLKDGKCSIYETRPEACKYYSCKNDHIMQKIKEEKCRMK